ncbi:MAG: helix-turn-helix transcriptional regulator [Phycisphaeraceae bacterium]|nr:MAG: helix-turn-helix transcriptional regulator [Phycisphaeraceae bacterium]
MIPRATNLLQSAPTDHAPASPETAHVRADGDLADPDAVWFHLLTDGIVASNSEACGRWLLTPDRTPAPGQPLHLEHLFGVAMAAERTTFALSCSATGTAGTLNGMIRGHWCRTVHLPQAGTPVVRCVVAPALPWPNFQGSRDTGSAASPRRVTAHHHDLGRFSSLMPIELHTLVLIAQGLGTQSIALKLGKSQRTVQWHQTLLLERLHVQDRSGLHTIAAEAGLSRLNDAEVASLVAESRRLHTASHESHNGMTPPQSPSPPSSDPR